MYTQELGGYCEGVPPLTFPNREVKPFSADGTGTAGRVGRRLFMKALLDYFSKAFSIYVKLYKVYWRRPTLTT